MARMFARLVLILTLTPAAMAANKPPTCKDFEAAVASGRDAQKLSKFIETSWTYSMMEYPEYATYLGYPGQDDRWSDLSLASIDRRKKDTVCQARALKKIKRSALTGEDRVNFDLMVYRYDEWIAGHAFPEEYLQLNQIDGPHTAVADMMTSMPQTRLQNFEDRIRRLEKTPQRIEQSMTLLREGLRKKITPPRFLLEKVPAQFDQVLPAKPEDSPFYVSFKEIPSGFDAKAFAKLQEHALKVIRDQVYPAMKKLRAFVADEYIPGAREGIAMSDLPEGGAWYAYAVRSQTTITKSPQEIHDLGLHEVARLKAEMEKVKNESGFKGDLKAFNKFLLDDSRFYHRNSKDLLTAYQALAKRIDPELPKLFKTLPRLTYGVREMPAYKAATSPTAYYQSGSPETGRAGYFEANTSNLKSRPIWGMEALTVHEAVPGHHLQIAIAQELQGLPEFRNHGGYTSFVEGWALYAESLGYDIGLYKDPYSKYGQLSYEMWRAVRLVVDTGMHQLGWSRQKSIEFFLDAVPFSQSEAEVEVDRYIVWPGQALAYKIGQLKFLELRERARAELGDKFDIREYHDEVLRHGALPLPVLEKSFEDWLHGQKKLGRAK